MPDLAQEAREKLRETDWTATIDNLWRRVALESVASGSTIEPLTAELRKFTMPHRIWKEFPAWREWQWSYFDALVATHHLAIARADTDWLLELDACWTVSPENLDLWRIYSQGQIGLALRQSGPRPNGWTLDELDWLTDEDGLLSRDRASDRAWLAIASGDLGTAHVEIDDALTAVRAHPLTLSDVLSHPSGVLHTEIHALQRLVDDRS